jgi:hypothetical protein
MIIADNIRINVMKFFIEMAKALMEAYNKNPIATG